MRSRVVLPAPLGPASQVRLRGGSSRLTSSSTRLGPQDFEIDPSRSTGSSATGASTGPPRASTIASMAEERRDGPCACGRTPLGQPFLRQVAAISERPWTGEAFGLSIASAVSLPGLARGPASGGPRPLLIDVVPRLESSRGERLVEWRDSAGDIGLVIE